MGYNSFEYEMPGTTKENNNTNVEKKHSLE